MWHRVDDQNNIVESVETLRPSINPVPPGTIFADGWRKGVPGPVPLFDPAAEVLHAEFTYDVRTGLVTEGWTVIPKSIYLQAAEARDRRLLDAQAKTDPILAAVLKYKET